MGSYLRNFSFRKKFASETAGIMKTITKKPG